MRFHDVACTGTSSMTAHSIATHQSWTCPTQIRKTGSNNKCLDMAFGDSNAGQPLLAFDCNGGERQLFSFTPFGDGFRMRPKSSRMCVEMVDAKPENGVLMHQWECLNRTSQVFRLTPGKHLAARPCHAHLSKSKHALRQRQNAWWHLGSGHLPIPSMCVEVELASEQELEPCTDVLGPAAWVTGGTTSHTNTFMAQSCPVLVEIVPSGLLIQNSQQKLRLSWQLQHCVPSAQHASHCPLTTSTGSRGTWPATWSAAPWLGGR